MTQETLSSFIEDALSQLSFLRVLATQEDHKLGVDYNNGYADGFAQCLGVLNDHLSRNQQINEN